MVRVENWPLELSRYLDEKSREPFQWGKNDCMMFVSMAVERLTGHNFYNDYIGYNSLEGAKEVLEKNGGVLGIITKCLGKGHKNFLQACRGDIVMVKIPEYTAGIVDDTGQRIAVVTENGLHRIDLNNALRVWSY